MFVKITDTNNQVIYVNENHIIRFWKTEDYTTFILTYGTMHIKETPCDLILFPSNDYSVAVIRNNEYTKMRLISKNAGDWCDGYLRKLLVARNLSDFEFNRIIGWINRGQR
jgi:hypothetical protein